MTYCSNCGSANNPSSKFCNNCGALLSAPTDVRCAICGTANKLDSGFCSTCGARLNAHSTSPSEKPETITPLRNSPVAPRQSAPETLRPQKENDERDQKAEPKSRSAPRMPQWVTRLRATYSGEPTSPPSKEESASAPAWLRDSRGASTSEPGNAKRPTDDDWLANLRAAVVEPEAANEESPAPAEKGEPLPIPQWFGDIRPPATAAPAEPGSAAEPISTPTAQDSEELPEWLRELHSPATEATAEAPRAQPDAEAISPTQTIQSNEDETLREWLVQMQPTLTAELPSEAEARVESFVSNSGTSAPEQNAASGENLPVSVVNVQEIETPLAENELPAWLAALMPLSHVEMGSLPAEKDSARAERSVTAEPFSSSVQPPQPEARDFEKSKAAHSNASASDPIASEPARWLRKQSFPSEGPESPISRDDSDESEQAAEFSAQAAGAQMSLEPEDLPDWLQALVSPDQIAPQPESLPILNLENREFSSTEPPIEEAADVALVNNTELRAPAVATEQATENFATDQDLPDWLKQAVRMERQQSDSQANEPQPEPPPLAEEERAELSDWSQTNAPSMSIPQADSEMMDEEPAQSSEQPPTEFAAPVNFASATKSDVQGSEREEIPDWLRDAAALSAAQANVDSTSKAALPSSAQIESESAAPFSLENIDSQSTAPFSIEKIKSEPTVSRAELPATEPGVEGFPEWLRDAAPAQNVELPEATANTSESESSELESSQLEELPQWLNQVMATSSGSEPAAEFTTTEAGPLPPVLEKEEPLEGVTEAAVQAPTFEEIIPEAFTPEVSATEASIGEMPAAEATDHDELFTEVPMAATEASPALSLDSTADMEAGETIQPPAATGRFDEVKQALADESTTPTQAPALQRGELPEWLQELAPRPELDFSEETTPALDVTAARLEETEREELPDWLREPVQPDAIPEPVFASVEPELESPHAPIPPAAELPGWIQEIKPSAETLNVASETLAPKEPLAEIVETSGPLAGVRGVLPVAYAIAQPHVPTITSASRADGAGIFESVFAASAETPHLVPTAAEARGSRFSLNHLFYLLLLLAALVPLFFPPSLAGLGLSVTNTPTVAFFDQIQAVPSGSTVLIAFDYDTGQTVELNPAARLVLDDLARRGVNVIALSLNPTGAQIAQTVLDDVSRQHSNWQRGTNFVNVGYVPGAEAGVRALADHWLPSDQLDFQKQSLAAAPLATRVNGLRDLALVIEFAGSQEHLRWWMEQAWPLHKNDTTFVAAVSAAVDSHARNYFAAHQLGAFLRGLSGAAEYELSLNQAGQTVRTVDAQSFTHVVLFAIIILGNLALLFARLKEAKAKS